MFTFKDFWAKTAAKLRNVFPNFFLKMEDFNFDLEIIIRYYYLTSMFIPVFSSQIWNTANFSESDSVSHFGFLFSSRRKSFVYLFTRLCVLLGFIQAVVVFIKNSFKFLTTGQVEIFGFFTLIITLTMYVPFYCTDEIFLNSSSYFLQLITTFRRIFKKGKSPLDKETLAHLQFLKSLKVWRLVIHCAILDVYSIINFAWTTFQDLEGDIFYFRVAFPWNTPAGNAFYWFFQQIVLVTVDMVWSAMFAFPGVVAYHYECAINILTKSVEVEPTAQYSMTEILDDYRNLEYSIRILNEKGFAKILLVFLLAIGVAPIFESYCMFRLIKSGASWDDYQLLFQDMLVGQFELKN